MDSSLVSAPCDSPLAASYALRNAAREGQFEQARDVLEETAVRINEQGRDDGWTALHCAARADALDIVQLLLTHGARHDVVGFMRETALDVAIWHEHDDVIQVLERHAQKHDEQAERSAEVKERLMAETMAKLEAQGVSAASARHAAREEPKDTALAKALAMAESETCAQRQVARSQPTSLCGQRVRVRRTRGRPGRDLRYVWQSAEVEEYNDDPKDGRHLLAFDDDGDDGMHGGAVPSTSAGAGAGTGAGAGAGAGSVAVVDGRFRQWVRLHKLVFIVERGRKAKDGVAEPEALVGARVRVKVEGEWLEASVGDYDEDNLQHFLQYDDGDDGWFNLGEMSFTVTQTREQREAAEEEKRRQREEEEARVEEERAAAEVAEAKRKKKHHKKKHKHKSKK